MEGEVRTHFGAHQFGEPPMLILIRVNGLSGCAYTNPLSGIAIGALGILISAAEMGELYYGYEKNFKPLR